MEINREIEATTGILSESSMENLFLISVINTCKKHSHDNIGRSFIKRLTSGASSYKEWYNKWQQMTTSDNTWQQTYASPNKNK